ncbi:hypothetical protein BGZ82_008254 [Podila clonocystis]|nr:hypothetical protein BGZ82_008254 [Podila clonocystis]
MSSPNVALPPVSDPAPVTTPAPPTTTPAPPPATTPATTPPAPPATTTPSPILPPTTSDEPQPPLTSDDPSTKTSTSRGTSNTHNPKPSGGGSGGTTNPPVTGGSGNNNTGSGTGTGISDSSKSNSKSVVGPVIGGIAAVLVLAFLIGVFVMRWRKKSQARKRLDVLLDQSGQGHDQIASALGGSPSVGGAGKPRPSSINSSVARPSNVGQMEMAAVGTGAGVVAQQQKQQQQQQQQQYQQQQYQHDGYDNYDYQQGYQQVPYGGYQDQYDQYDPYYSQQQPMAQGHQPTGYYSETSPHLQNQLQGQGQHGPGQHGYTGSPSMTHSSASPSSYPQPPASNTAGSPRTPLQSATTQTAGGLGSAYDRFNKIELSDYANTQSPARNPQVIPEERVKAPM